MLNAKERLHTSPSGDLEQEPAAVEPPLPDSAPVADTEDVPAQSAIPDLIVELAELRQKGIISEEEFQTKKKELLDRL
jgi:hypothetical protein